MPCVYRALRSLALPLAHHSTFNIGALAVGWNSVTVLSFLCFKEPGGAVLRIVFGGLYLG